VIAGIVAYLSYKTYVLVTKSNTQLIRKSFYRDLDIGVPENYTIQNSSFDFAF
jgi:hypothetical protein